jgi:hypothetical protein
MKSWLLNRLGEASTWRGLVWIITVSGVLLTPEQTEAIVLFGMALAGVLGVFCSDKPQTVNVVLPPVDLVSPTANRMRELQTEFYSKVDGNGFGDK